MSFSNLGLSQPITQAIEKIGYEKPTNIQTKAIPTILQGEDLIAAAQTGTGKTASFVLPMLEKLSQESTQRKKRIRGLILTPTRELAVQIEEKIQVYSQNLSLTSLAMYGGVDEKSQKQALIDGVDILVATPGRLLDMYSKRAVHFDEVEILVLDEADRMLDMGFIEDINKILNRLPKDIQSLLFSATLSHKVRDLAKTAVHDPFEISIAAHQASKKNIEQWLITVDKDKKSALLSHLIKENNWDQALIFIETKHGAAKLAEQLEKRGIEAEAFHSGRSQAIRSKLLEDFKAGNIKFMIATGVGARGIDIEGLTRVINYDLPFPADEYIHRIGRTGRADAQGEAISFVSKDNFKNLCMIESRLGHLLERREIEGFEPRKSVPVSILNYVPKNKRKSEDNQ
ncbi:DEAD/DEAH box helicase [Vibrio pectenicida]|uniref:DEAD-box ATP-dependent RNA helicase RhpA n=1 Tax=Vibrio pectenicida TaxID=62763 RepID=A0A7Y4EES6_9VIBR|nr:DEAD/DEAH box helicase [Vibrio pectenicida]NOH71673.1 DEAD/DEAH box helicase [Vibrio pectenicida]